ncbi:hypothetical protein AVEN_125830-1 [Araneus ventricosus]|uniref:Uncharacterized protein n=1 Tax=Araneus ventricosus TaxID=182803 RepID=A0A4Y2NWA6_ARAVE|nr:hypothetical protein AVEN_125830-1 [Araneus ventricosus]
MSDCVDHRQCLNIHFYMRRRENYAALSELTPATRGPSRTASRICPRRLHLYSSCIPYVNIPTCILLNPLIPKTIGIERPQNTGRSEFLFQR